MLIGKDIILKDRMPEASVAFRSMLQVSEDYLIAGLRVLQSMVSVYSTAWCTYVCVLYRPEHACILYRLVHFCVLYRPEHACILYRLVHFVSCTN